MAKRRRPPSQGWKTFLHNHADGIASMDFFVVPTISFRLLYGLLILQHARRERRVVTGKPNKIRHFRARSIAFVHVRLRRFIGQSLVRAGLAYGMFSADRCVGNASPRFSSAASRGQSGNEILTCWLRSRPDEFSTLYVGPMAPLGTRIPKPPAVLPRSSHARDTGRTAPSSDCEPFRVSRSKTRVAKMALPIGAVTA
jgi:hypothetical protein